MKSLVLLVGLLIAAPAHASWYLQFDVVADSEDPLLYGVGGPGDATFDLNPGGAVRPTMTDFEFNWGGVNWDETNTTFTWLADAGWLISGSSGDDGFVLSDYAGIPEFNYSGIRAIGVSGPVGYPGSVEGWYLGYFQDQVPEPSTAPLLALGLALPLGFVMFRKRRE